MLRPTQSNPQDQIWRVYHKQSWANVSSVWCRQGDLLKDGLGFSAADEAKITNTCNIIINCAASIDFTAPIDSSIDSNIRGSLRMLELARRTKNL